MGDENLVPDLIRTIDRLTARIEALEARQTLQGARNLNDLEDVSVNVLTRADAQVVRWNESIQSWVNGTAGAGFPITFDDGTYTYKVDGGVAGFGGDISTIVKTILNAGSVVQSELDLGQSGLIQIRAGAGVDITDTGGSGIAIDGDGGGGVFIRSDNGEILLDAHSVGSGVGVVIIKNLPTSSAGLVTNQVWRDGSGFLKII